MSDPYDMPTCSNCGDVAMYCKCIEKLNDENFAKFSKGKKCPSCSNKNDILSIEYGYPGEDMIDRHDKGQIKLGGCTIDETNPDYHCKKCDYEWQGSYYNR